MSAETQLFAALSGYVPLAGLVGTRIFPVSIPENRPLPSVVFTRTSSDPTYTIGGVLICEDVHFSITAWAETQSDAEAIADQIDAALAATGNNKQDRSSGYDQESGLCGATIEIDWFWSA